MIQTDTFFRNVIFSFLISLISIFNVYAQDPLIEYSFDGYDEENDESYPPDNINSPYINVSEFTKGDDLDDLANPAIDKFSARGWLSTITNPTDEYYIEFSISPTDQNYFDITSIEFKIKRSTQGPGIFVLRSNFENNFNDNIDNQTIAVEEYFTSEVMTLDNAYQGVTESLTIRFYGYNSSDEWGTIQIDDLQIYGEAFDATPPAMYSGYPSVSDITQNSFDITVNANETGIAHILVQEDGTAPPSTSDVINGADETINVDDTETDFPTTINNLDPSTTYDAYVVLEDDVGNASDTPIELADITTLNLENIFVANGETRTLSKDVTVNDYIQIDAGGELVLEEDVTLSIGGDFTNNGSFTDNDGALNFIGSTVQRILGSSGINAHNIIISNTSGVINETSVDLTNNLKLSGNAEFDADGSSNNRSFTLVSTASQTAQITTIEDGAILNGDITLQRYIGNGPPGWKYFSVPIKGQQTTHLQDDFLIQGVDNSYPNAAPQLYTYEESAGTDDEGINGWQGITSSSFAISNKGLRAYLYPREFEDGPLTLDYTGEPFIGDGADNSMASGESCVVSLDYTSSAYDGGGWNLVQNPYPCKIDWDDVELSGDIDPSIYIWNPDGQTWASYTPGEGPGTNGASQYIASGQSFFIKTNSGGQSITFEESDKATGTNNAFLRKSNSDNWLKINIAADDKDYQDELLLKQDAHASENYDMHRDAYNLPGGWIDLGALKNDSTSLSIYSTSRSNGIDTIPLEIVPYHFGDYTIRFDSDNEDDTQFLLHDRYTQKTFDPDSVDAYSLRIIEDDSTSFTNRFEVLHLPQINLAFEAQSGQEGDTIAVDVYAQRFNDIHSAAIKMRWDTALLHFTGQQLVGMPEGNSHSFDQLANGDLSFNWSMPEGEVIALEETTLFALEFVITGNADVADVQFKGSGTKIKSLNDTPLQVKMENSAVDIVNKSLVEGMVYDTSGEPISGVEISSENIQTTLSRNDGSFEFEAVEGVLYDLSAHKLFTPDSTHINLVDLIRLRTHISSTGDLSNKYQIIAADVDRSQSLDGADVDLMKEYLLNKDIPPSFNEWLFIHELQSHSIDPFSYDTVRRYEYDNPQPIEFTGIRIGALDRDPLETNGTLEIQHNSKTASHGNMINTFTLAEADSVGLLGFKFTFTYDVERLNLLSLDNPGIPGEIMKNEKVDGRVVVLWESQLGRKITFGPGEELFNITFKKINDDTSHSPMVKIDTALNSSIAVSKYIKPMSISQKEMVTALNEDHDQFKLRQNYPNPAIHHTTFSFYTPKTEKIDLSVYNLVGEKVFQHNDVYEKGWHKIKWKLNEPEDSNIRPGVYVYIVNTVESNYTRKLVIE